MLKAASYCAWSSTPNYQVSNIHHSFSRGVAADHAHGQSDGEVERVEGGLVYDNQVVSGVSAYLLLVQGAGDVLLHRVLVEVELLVGL